ncbi:unnamed protein product [Mytilus coruscus]|uniref:Uncharacterized protein n=1 Tax=Mytilus coruscus TaxID=42192 RepID=A0A6J7ZXC0_MYTCO|nr:unnamed protein product [Mytilus coruscus]
MDNYGGTVLNALQHLSISVVFVHEMSCPSETDLPSQENENILAWRDGLRLVELGLLANQLKACKNCNAQLFLDNSITENRYGLRKISSPFYLISKKRLDCAVEDAKRNLENRNRHAKTYALSIFKDRPCNVANVTGRRYETIVFLCNLGSKHS